MSVNACATKEDHLFRTQVRTVLRHASDLERATDYIAERDRILRDDELTKRTREVEAYLDSVAHLPAPHDKKLRYLAMRLHDLGTQARSLLNWNGILWLAAESDAGARDLGLAG